MGWSIGYDEHWKRDIGYGVPAYCDHPGCNKVIDRGLSYVCADGRPYGGRDDEDGKGGCGLYFCDKHRGFKCKHKGFEAKPDHPKWMRHQLTDKSWKRWRDENPDEVAKLRHALQLEGAPAP